MTFDALLQQWNECHTPRSDLLHVIGRNRRETVLCAALAWLLDPNGSHGLGHAVSSRFLASLGVAGRVTTTSTEWVRGTRRADIVVLTESKHTIVIEAKVEAGLDFEQLNDTAANWAEPSTQLVALLPRPPDVLPNPWAGLAWSTVHAWLRAATQDLPRSPPAVLDLLQTLEADFPNEAPMTQLPSELAFYLEHRVQIQQWAKLEEEAATQADAFFHTLRAPLQEAAKRQDAVVWPTDISGHSVPKQFLVRDSWCDGDNARVAIGFEWRANTAAFHHGVIGVWVDQRRKDGGRLSKSITALLKDTESWIPPHKGKGHGAWWANRRRCSPIVLMQQDDWWTDLDALRNAIVQAVEDRFILQATAVDRALGLS